MTPIQKLPCSSCTAVCCGPVPLSAVRVEKIRAYLKTLVPQEQIRLANQPRREEDCRFLDKEDHSCAIYPVRPWVCEAFGRVHGMPCPKTPGLVQIIPAFIEETNMTAEYESGVVGNSSKFDWRKFK